MNEGIFLWIQDWVVLEASEGSEDCCRDQGTHWKCFLAQGSTSKAHNPPKCRRCSRHKKQTEPPCLCDIRPNYDRLRILASGDDPSLCGWRGSPKLIILLVYHLLDIEFLLVSEHEVRQRTVGHLLEDFPAFLDPHGHMIGRKLLVMQHLKWLHLQIVPQHLLHRDLLTPAAVAKVLQLRRGFQRSFSLVFLRSWGERTLRFLPRSGR